MPLIFVDASLGAYRSFRKVSTLLIVSIELQIDYLLSSKAAALLYNQKACQPTMLDLVSLSKGRYRDALTERSRAMDSTSGNDLDDM